MEAVSRAGVQLDHYRLLAPIGRGGMAEVWHARGVGPGGFRRDCALKLLVPPAAHDRAAVGRFLHEATVSARLHHPGIVSVYDFGQSGGRYFIAMERLAGCDLRELLRAMARPQAQSVGFAAYVALKTAAALHYAHTLRDDDGAPLGLVHCDVTPSNIMLTYDGAVKLLDFGVARSREHLPPDAPAGKWAYMSPEQIRGEALDRRADVFALGVVLWETLTCRRLFYAATPAETQQRALCLPIEKPSRINSDVPPALDRIVLRALARSPGERYADCRELGAALTGILGRFRFGAASCASLVRWFFVDDAPTTVHTPSRSPSPPARPRAARLRARWRRWWRLVVLSLVRAILLVASRPLPSRWAPRR